MIRYKVTIGWWDDPVNGGKSVYKEKNYRGLAVGPSTREALAQIEERYGEDIQSLTFEYTDDMDYPIYDGMDEQEMPWMTKED